MIKRLIAKILHKLGFKPIWSIGIHGGITCGYGKLSDNGFWQYPLPVAQDLMDDIKQPICPLNLYFEGEEKLFNSDKCDFKDRRCSESCKTDLWVYPWVGSRKGENEKS